MKFFRNIFGKGEAPIEVSAQSVDAAYSDVLSRPARNDAVGTAEITAKATRKAHRRVEAIKKNVASAKSGAQPAEQSEKSTMSMIRDINAKLEQTGPEGAQPSDGQGSEDGASTPSIWDLDEDSPATGQTEKIQAAPEAPRASTRQRRTKTRLIGFDTSDGNVVDAFGQMPTNPVAEEPQEPEKVVFPVGWIVVVKGPGRGESFALINGLSSIGRGADQTVPLKFGDSAISRNGHAAIVYDGASRTFTLGHGNKANIVRLNDQPLISNEPVKNGDLIKIGETTLRMVVLCDDGFDWSDFDDEGDEDVAIA